MPDTLRSSLIASINKLSGMVARADAGDTAALRRLDPANPAGSTFWNFLQEAVPAELRQSERWENAWAMIMQGMATMKPNHHRNGGRLGSVLAKAGYSEARLNKLLRIDPRHGTDTLERMARFLAAKNAAFDWCDLVGLLFFNGQAADKSRRAIARSYYTAN